MRSISIIHPSRERPEIAHKVAQKWLSLAENRANIEYIMCLDESDPLLHLYESGNPVSQIKRLVKDNKNMIEAANHGAAASTGDILILVSDDFDCPPGWDTWLLNTVGDRTDFSLKVPDGYTKNYYLRTIPILDRTYYNRFGDIYNPVYTHMYCDTEATTVAVMLGKLIFIPDEGNPVFRHLHYTRGLSPKDHINTKNDASMQSGAQIFFSRHAKNFDLDPAEIVTLMPIEYFR